MSYCAGSTTMEAGRQRPGTVRLTGLLTVSHGISHTGQTTLVFAGELDAVSADQAFGYVKDAIDTYGGPVLLNVARLSFCDARGLGALVRMSRHAERSGSSLHLVAPRPLLARIIHITGLDRTLPVYRGN